jgi:hypothetical protein
VGDFFLNIALFFSFFRRSMISLAITKLEHRLIRQMRFRHITSGGHDNAPFEAGKARRRHMSHPPDASAPFEAGNAGRRHLSHPPDASGPRGATSASFNCCRARRLRQGGQKNGAHPPLGSPLPHSPVASPCSSRFSLLSFSSNLSF